MWQEGLHGVTKKVFLKNKNKIICLHITFLHTHFWCEAHTVLVHLYATLWQGAGLGYLFYSFMAIATST